MIKTNELQSVSAIVGTDSILADTNSRGTARVPFDAATQFFKDTFMNGGVPYGKELSDSWATLKSRIAAGDFKGIHIGDFKTITLTTGEQVVMEVAGIDHYYKCSDQQNGHHIDFISRDCLANNPSGKFKFNDTDTNNGTAESKSPWLASKLFQTLNDEANGVYATLPSDLKPCVIQKRALLEERYSSAGAVSEDTSWSWQNMGKLWLPTEVEVFGCHHWSDAPYGTGGSVQYPIFIGGFKHIIKGNGKGGSRYRWWQASAPRGSAAHVCHVNLYGNANPNAASTAGISVPLCFRIG